LRTGYYLDKNGVAHRPNGQSAKKGESDRTLLEKFGDNTIGLANF
jgi:hypothetical protein